MGTYEGLSFLASSMLIIISSFPVIYSSGEFDAITVVSTVTYGDTFETTTEGTVRLADIDAPEYDEDGYQSARIFLISFIHGKTISLDIDDLYRTDAYDRLICVAYVQYNLSHYINVNKALLMEGYAEISDYDNEFSPYTWATYVHVNNIPESPIVLLLVFIVGTLLTVIFNRKKLYH